MLFLKVVLVVSKSQCVWIKKKQMRTKIGEVLRVIGMWMRMSP